MKKAFLYCVYAASIFSALTGCAHTADELEPTPEATPIVVPAPAPEATPIVEPTPTPKEYTLSDLEDWQLSIFETTSLIYIDDVLSNKMTVGELDEKQADLIEAQLIDGILPSNAIQLFAEWKESTGFYDQFSGSETQQPAPEEQQQQQQSQSGSQQQTSKPSGDSTTQSPTPPQTQGNKPQPSDQQQHQQVQSGEQGSTEIAPSESGGFREQEAAKGHDAGGTVDQDTFHSDQDYSPIR